MAKTSSFGALGSEIDELVSASPYGNIKTFIGADSFDIEDYGEPCRLIIPPNVTEIDDYEYMECGNLIEVIVMGSRVKLGDSPFGENLERLVFLGEPEFEDDAYYRLQNLSEIVFPKGYKPDENALEALKGSPYFENLDEFKIINDVLVEYTGSDKVVRVPDGVTQIGAGQPVFKNALCRRISRFLPKVVFKEPELNSIEIILPESVEIIDDCAFCNTSVRKVNIPENVWMIGCRAFAGSSVSRITLPEGLTDIGEEAFTASDITRIEIPEGVREIKEDTFERCTKLTRVILPKSVKSIRERAFDSCESLKEITIPNPNTVIDEYAFPWVHMRKDKEHPVIVRAPEGSTAEKFANNYKLPNIFKFKKLKARESASLKSNAKVLEED